MTKEIEEGNWAWKLTPQGKVREALIELFNEMGLDSAFADKVIQKLHPYVVIKVEGDGSPTLMPLVAVEPLVDEYARFAEAVEVGMNRRRHTTSCG